MPISGSNLRYIALSLLCYESEPKIDMDKFRTLTGLASVASAREMLRQAKKKLNEEHITLQAEVPAELSLASKPKRGRVALGLKRKSPVKSEVEDAGDEDAEEMTEWAPPAKKRKTAPPQAGPRKKRNAGGDKKVDEKMIKNEAEDADMVPSKYMFDFGDEIDDFGLD